MGEVMGKSGQVFCSGYIVDTIFWNPQRMSLNMQGVWPSPIMLPIMLKGHDFRIITWRPPIRHLGWLWAAPWAWALETFTSTEK
jgi:hypothetical protein